MSKTTNIVIPETKKQEFAILPTFTLFKSQVEPKTKKMLLFKECHKQEFAILPTFTLFKSQVEPKKKKSCQKSCSSLPPIPEESSPKFKRQRSNNLV